MLTRVHIDSACVCARAHIEMSIHTHREEGEETCCPKRHTHTSTCGCTQARAHTHTHTSHMPALGEG